MKVTVETDGVEAIVEKRVTGGRIYGLGKYEGKKVKILILTDERL